MRNPLPWLTIGVCCLLLLPALFMDGMFLDGVFYAAISKNYASGLGTFWNPYYSATAFPSLHEQPPLMFFMQGMFFKILGNGIYTERIYCLLVALINSFLIYRCWKIVYPSPEKTGWLPVLLWFTMPVTFYVFINNLEECTMSIFVLATMIHLLRAMHIKQKETFHLVVAGGMLLLAGLTKGIQGMFLLAAPFTWWLCIRDTNFITVMRRGFFVALIPVLFIVCAWFTPVIHESFRAYFNARIVATFNHQNDTSDSRFHILYELLLDSLPLLCMSVVALFAFRNKIAIINGWKQHKGLILFFILTCVSGVLPLMVTLEQRGFYLVPALPFLTLAFSLFIAPQVIFFLEKLRQQKKRSVFIGVFGMVIIAGSLISAVYLSGKPKRDHEKLNDLQLIFAVTGKQKILLLDEKTKYEWGLYAYAMRYHNVSLTGDKQVTDNWLIREKDGSSPAGYQLITLPTIRYDLYKKTP